MVVGGTDEQDLVWLIGCGEGGFRGETLGQFCLVELGCVWGIGGVAPGEKKKSWRLLEPPSRKSSGTRRRFPIRIILHRVNSRKSASCPRDATRWF
eukprot:1939875-Rhodomonas_salina.1